MFACWSTILVRRKKKTKGIFNASDGNKKSSSNGDLRVKPIENDIKDHSFTATKVEKTASFIPKVLSNESLTRAESTGDAAYEGGDEQEDKEFSDLDLKPKEKLTSHGSNNELKTYVFNKTETEAKIASGHVSDPGIKNTSCFESPLLKRSCSNFETKEAKQWMNSPKRSNSYSSLLSLKSSCSADHVMLKRRSSSQVLPSRSKKIWWKLFLWSHRNLHKPSSPQRQIFSVSKQKEGYSSDKWVDKDERKVVENENQWVAFSLESSHMDRVNAWVKSLEDCSFVPGYVEENCEQIADSHHVKIKENSEKVCSHSCRREGEDLAQANSVIQSLNSFSSVAHISGIGLKVIPAISCFVCLRTVNLSGNSIVHITPGSLPKSLHTLDLSRNKISTIEGLRELERLRILNLSYNRITRIGHGLSSCTVIRELYLAGNKISNVEGLHRLLKLTVLDLSFNKITTSKALGQLVANYNSLLALNLLGNPIQTNIGDDQLKKAVLGLLPHVTYLNKQLIKPHRVREVVTKSVAKAALGDVARSSRRKLTRRLSQGSSSSSRSRVGEGSCRVIKHGKSRHSCSGKK